MHEYLSSIAGANSILRSASRPGIGGIKDASPNNTADPVTKIPKKLRSINENETSKRCNLELQWHIYS